MGYPSQLEYYMYGFQTHFRINCETTAESLFSKLDRGLFPQVSLFGFLRTDRKDRHKICVDPENLSPLIPGLAELQKLAISEYESSENRNMFYSGDGVQAIMDKKHKNESFRTVLENFLNELPEREQTITFVSAKITTSDFDLYVALELNKFVYNSRNYLKKKDTEQRFKLRLSLLESGVEIYLKEVVNAFHEPGPQEFYDFKTRATDELLREAANSFFYTIAWAGNEMQGLHGLIEACNKISQSRYESEEVRGNILIAKKSHPDIEMTVELVEPFNIREHRKTRKLLQQSDNIQSVITNSYHVLGLGKLKESYNPDDETIFKIKFNSLHCWEVLHDKTILFQLNYGLPQFGEEIIDKNTFYANAARVLSGIMPDEIENLYQLSISLTLQKRGAMLIISDVAQSEAERLRKQCLNIKPIKLVPDVLASLSAIDGGVLVDRYGVCYANAVLLDGIVGRRGDSARGSRYNSAITYQEGNELTKATMIIVVSEDGMVDIIPSLMPKISHSEIKEVINILHDIADNGSSENGTFNDAMQWLQNRQFYLKQDECDEINQLNKAISETAGPDLRIVYSDFHPNFEMNDSYYHKEP